jgi:hypothetical protein
MSGHCASCREFSVDLRDVCVEPAECLAGGMMIAALWYRLCETCRRGTIGAQSNPEPSDASTTSADRT